MKLNEHGTVVCDNCNKTRLECECVHFGAPEGYGATVLVGTSTAPEVRESAPLPGPFARVVPTALARKILRSLMDLHVPVSVEYVRSDVVLSVPMTFARVLDKERETAEREAGY